MNNSIKIGGELVAIIWDINSRAGIIHRYGDYLYVSRMLNEYQMISGDLLSAKRLLSNMDKSFTNKKEINKGFIQVTNYNDKITKILTGIIKDIRYWQHHFFYRLGHQLSYPRNDFEEIRELGDKMSDILTDIRHKYLINDKYTRVADDIVHNRNRNN